MMLRSGNITAPEGDNNNDDMEQTCSSSENEEELQQINPPSPHSNNDFSLTIVQLLNEMKQDLSNMKQDNLTLSNKMEQNQNKVALELKQDLTNKINQNNVENNVRLEQVHSSIRSDISNMVEVMEQKILATVQENIQKLEQKLVPQIEAVKIDCEILKINLKEKQDEVNNKIQQSEIKVNQVVQEVRSQNSDNSLKINQLDDKFKNLNEELVSKLESMSLEPKQVGCNYSHSVSNFGWRNHDLPKFNGKSENPLADLNRIKQYINMNSKDYHLHGKWETISNVLSMCFTSSAASWFETILPRVSDWPSFEQKFHEVYWNSSKIMSIRLSILNGKYHTNGKDSTIEYFQKKFSLAVHAFESLDEKEIIDLLAKHFHSQIQNAVLVQSVDSYNKMLSLLQRFQDSGDSSFGSGSQANNNTFNSRRSPPYNNNNQFRNDRPNPRNFNNHYQSDNPRYNPYNRNNNYSNYQQSNRFGSRNNNGNSNFNQRFSRPNQNRQQFTPQNRSNQNHQFQNRNSNNQEINAIQVSHSEPETINHPPSTQEDSVALN